MRVGGIAGALQRGGEAVRVLAGAARPGVALVAEQARVVGEALGVNYASYLADRICRYL